MAVGRIYALAAPGTAEIRYCGKTTRPMPHRLAGHYADTKRALNRHLCNWLTKLDRTGAWPPTVIVCEEVDLTGLDRKVQIAKLNEAEIRWIAQLRALGFSLLNATKGGDGSHGRPIPEEQRQKMAASNRGQKRTLLTRERMRQAALKRDPTTLLRGAAHQHFGKKIPFKDPEGRLEKLRAAWADPAKRAAWAEAMTTSMSLDQRVKQSLRHQGSKNVNAVITEDVALAILRCEGRNTEIAKSFGVSVYVVGRIKMRKTWRHVAY